MANWYGTARTNYVKVQDFEGLKNSLQKFDITIEKHPLQEAYACLIPSTEDGDFPSYVWDEDTDKEVSFSFEDDVMPYIEEDEVLVMQVAGAEKHRYISGYSAAFVRTGSDVESVHVNMNEIYDKAAQAFGIQQNCIAECTCQDLPQSVTEQNKAPTRPKG